MTSHDILLLMTNLSRINDAAQVTRLFAEALNEAFAPAKVRFGNASSENEVIIPLKTLRGEYGNLVVDLTEAIGGGDLQLVQTACQLLAVMLENLDQRELAARQERERAERYLDVANALILALDSRGIVTMINRRGAELLQSTSEAIVGEEWFGKFFPSEVGEATRELFDKMVAGECEWATYHESEILAADGSQSMIAWHNAPLKDKSGKIIGALSSGQDITALRQAEDQHRESEGHYRSLFENMAQGAFYQRADSVLTDCNQAALDLFGLTRDQFLGRTSMHPEWRVVDDDGNEILPEEHASMIALQTGKAVPGKLLGVYNPVRQDYVWMIVNAIPQFRDGEDSPYQVFCTLHDVTERRAYEEELRRLTAVADQASDSIIVTDAEFKITYQNWAARQLYGYSNDELLGKSPDVFNAEEMAAELQTELYDTVARGDSYIGIFLNRRKDGSTFECEFTVSAVRNDRGEIVSYVGVQRDITKRLEAERALAKSEANLSALIENADGSIWSVDRKYHLMAGNSYFLEQASRVFGKDMALGDTLLLKDLPEGGIDEWRGYYDRAFSGERFCVEMSSRLSDPGRSVEYRFGPITEADGSISGATVIARDITERYKSEAELRGQKEFIDAALDAQKDTFFLFDPESGRAIRWNKVFRDVTGYSDEEIAELPVPSSYYSPRDVERAAATIETIMVGGSGSVELDLICKDGRRIPYEYRVSVIEDDEKKSRYFISIGRDISERRLAERRLIRAERCARAIGTLKEEILLVTELQVQLRSITETVVEVFDADFARVWVIEPGDRCMNGCIHADAVDGPHACVNREQCLHLKASSGRYTHIDGTHGRVPLGCYKIGRVGSGDEPRFVTNDAASDPRVHDHDWVNELGLRSFAGYRLLSAEGVPLGVMALFSKHEISPQDDAYLEDVAATASLAIQMFKAKIEKAELNAQLIQSQKLESVGTLARGVAHEINNPINGIMNYAQLIQDRTADAASPISEFAGEIKHETERVAGIVRNLLTFARQGHMAEFQDESVDELVAGALALIGTVMSNDQIKVEVEIADDLSTVSCRCQQIQQVLMNLMTNARDALNERYLGYDPDKIIRIAATGFEKDEKRWVRVAVEDHGCGIPEGIRERLFDPFFTSKATDKGTGLGLSISQGIVIDHGGRIYLSHSGPDSTCFHLDLPVAAPTPALTQETTEAE